MKPKSIRRKVFKWTGLLTLLLLMVVFLLSGWWKFSVTWVRIPSVNLAGDFADTKWVQVSDGQIWFIRVTKKSEFVRDDVTWYVYSMNSPQWRIWGSYKKYVNVAHLGNDVWTEWCTDLCVPLWIPVCLVGLPTVVAWYRDRRFPPENCQACNYNLTGNTSGICPECGCATKA